MKKILLFIPLILLGFILSAQSTNKNIIINKTAPMLQLNGSGAVLDFYNNDIRFTQSSDLLTLTGGNLKLPGISYGYTTTVTAAGVTTLTALSNYYQFFTGSTTQSVNLPVTSTLTTGHTYFIFNNSSGVVTVNSSGGNAVIVMVGGTKAIITCILTSGTTAASWDVLYSGHAISSGKKLTVTNTLSFAGTDGTTMTFPGTNASIARIDAGQSFVGDQAVTGQLTATTSIGAGTTTPLHKLSAVSTRAINLNAMNFVESDVNKNRTTVSQARDTSSLNLWFTYTGSPLLTMTDKNGGILFRADSIGFGLGTATPLTKLSVLSSTATNLNAFNFTNSDINKTRTTYATATDTSSITASYTATGSPTFKVVSKTGTNLLTIDSTQVSTAAQITITGNDGLVLSGNGTYWNDLLFPFTTGHVGNANYPPYSVDSLYFSFTVDSVGVDAQFMNITVQMPHDWKIGSTIYPHVHYKQEDATTDTPVFIVKYKWYDLGGTTQKGWRWIKLDTSTGTTDKTHQFVDNPNGISGSGITNVSSMLVCQVYLYALAAGNAQCNAWQFDIHYEIDGFGSRTDEAK